MPELLYVELGFGDYAAFGAAMARSQGFRTRLASADPERYRVPEFTFRPARPIMRDLPLDAMSAIDTIDTLDPEAVVAAYRDRDLSGVIAFQDGFLLTAARLAQVLGLPGADPEGLRNCIFKDRTRERTAGIGREIAYAVVPTGQTPATSPVGYPCIVKPAVGIGSYGVSLCHDDEQFADAVDEAIISYRATGGAGDAVPTALVEEYVEGGEFSGELLWDSAESRWRLLGVTRTSRMTPPPTRREIGHVFPWTFGGGVDPIVADTLVAWLEAAGHRMGGAHIEFRMDGNVPALIEINPRLAGGGLTELVRLTTGFDPIDGYQRLCRGESVSFPEEGRYLGHAALYDLLTPKAGQVKEIDRPRRAEGIVEVASREPAELTWLPAEMHLAYAIAHAEGAPEAAMALASTYIDAMSVGY
ncbi:ATP-grasp domain-containing protein [Embleya sp. NPDC001921]